MKPNEGQSHRKNNRDILSNFNWARMTVTNMFKIPGALMLCMMLCVGCGCKAKSTVRNIDQYKIFDLSYSLSYEGVVSELASFAWADEKDPALLMLYCKVLVETGRDLPSGLTSIFLPTHVRKFAYGSYTLERGNLMEANRVFTQLAKGEKGKVWAYIGMLECALREQHVRNMKYPLELLQSLIDKDPFAVPGWVIPYYGGGYQCYCGMFEQARQTVSKYSDQSNPWLPIDLKVSLLLREDNFDEAERVVKTLPANYQMSVDLEGEIIRLRYGPEKWLGYLKEKIKTYPHFWLVEMRIAEARIELGELDTGLHQLKELVNKHPFERSLRLSLAAKLLEAARGKEFKELFHGDLEDAVPYIPFQYYHYLLAIFYETEGCEKISQDHFGFAKDMYPKSGDVLWFAFITTMRKHNYEKARDAIDELLEIEPNNAQALLGKMELYSAIGKWSEILELEKKVNGSRRWVDKKTRQKAKALGDNARLKEKTRN